MRALSRGVKQTFWLVAAIAMALSSALPAAYAATYYVDALAGNDGNSGSAESPWQTITRADDPVAGVQPGDTVVVRAGDYYIEYGAGDIKYRSGQPGSPITYKAEGVVNVVADVTPAFRIFGSTTEGENQYTVSDIVIDGFCITGSYSGVQIIGADRITVRNCKIRGIDDPHPGDYDQQRMVDLTEGESDGCVIEKNILGDLSDSIANRWAVGIIGATNTKIYNNTMVKAGCALCQLAGSGTEFKNNIAYDMLDPVMWVDTGASSVAHSNNIWFNTLRYCQDPAIVPGPTEKEVDPMFVGVEPYKYLVKAGSPAVDAGVDVGLPFNGAAPEIGAVESPNTTNPTVYHVKPDGNDALDGLTFATAWKTWNRGGQLGILKPCDTVLIEPGTYTVPSGLDYVGLITDTVGMPSYPIVFKANGPGVVLEGNGGNNAVVLYPSNRYLQFDGFQVQNFYKGFWVLCSDVTIRNCSFSSSVGYGAGVIVDPIFATGLMEGITVEKCLFHDCMPQSNYYNCVRTHGSTDGLKVFNNTFDNVHTAIVLIDWGLEGIPGNYNYQIKNNIISNVTSALEIYGESSGERQFNLWYNVSNGYPSLDTGEIFGENPMYVGGGNYNLQSGSPAIDTGAYVGWPHQGKAPDRGAFESPYSRTGVTYHVRTDGNDALDGLTYATAWKTWNRGAELRVLKAGDTVLIEPGTYTVPSGRDYVALISYTAGAPNNPIVFKANGPGVVLDGTSNGVVIYPSCRYLEFDGFQVQNFFRSFWVLCGEVTIKNCSISSSASYGAGVIVDPYFAKKLMEGITVENCLFHDCMPQSNYYNCVRTQGSTDGLKVFNNTFDNVHTAIVLIAWGLQSSPGNYNYQIKNNITSNSRGAIEYYGESTGTRQYNLYYNLTNAVWAAGAGEIFGEDPLYIGGGNYNLQSGSPAIDAGIYVGLPYKGAAPDLGAFESSYVTPVGSIGELSQIADGVTVELSSVVVTVPSGTFAGGVIYVEEASRAAGIRVVATPGSPAVSEGDRVTVTGTLATNAAGERELQGASVVVTSGGDALGSLGTNEKGIVIGGIGAGTSTSGLLMKVWGKVLSKANDNTYVYVDDGSALTDASGKQGIRVQLDHLVTPISTIPDVNDNITVVGVVGLASDGGSAVPVIRPRSGADITKTPAP